MFPEGGLTNGFHGLLKYHKFMFGLDVPVLPRAIELRPSVRAHSADTCLASAELATGAAITGKLPHPAEYLEAWKKIDSTAADTYRYLNFDQLPEFTEAADFALDAEAEDEAAAILRGEGAREGAWPKRALAGGGRGRGQ